MKQKKKMFMNVVVYDYLGIQERLTKLAAEGWRLEGVSGGFGIWHFRRAEPARVRYEVTYAPSGSEYNPRPTDAERSLEDYCAEAGWHKVASLAQMHIYCNEDPNAVPIETDDAVRLKTIHAAMKKNFLPTQWVLLSLWCLNLGMRLWDLARDPLRVLSSGIIVLNIVLMLWLVILYMLMLYGYYHWRSRARAATEKGEPIPAAAFPRRLRGVTWAALVLIFAGLIAVSEKWVVLITFAGTFAVLWLSIKLTGLMKKKEVPADVNRFYTFGLVFLLTVVLVAAVPLVILSQTESNRAQEAAAVPLSMSDLIGGKPTDYLDSVWRDGGGSFVDYRHHVLSGKGAVVGYDILDFESGILRTWLEEQMLRQVQQRLDGKEEIPLTQVDEPLWNAERVYCCQAPDGEELWLICWDRRFVCLSSSFRLSREQIAIASEKLAP